MTIQEFQQKIVKDRKRAIKIAKLAKYLFGTLLLFWIIYGIFFLKNPTVTIIMALVNISIISSAHTKIRSYKLEIAIMAKEDIKLAEAS